MNELDRIRHVEKTTAHLKFIEPYYNYSFKFIFEEKWAVSDEAKLEMYWFYSSWHICLLYSIVYVCLVFLGQRIMKNREKFHLYRSLISWNILLALFSIIGTIRVWPSFLANILHNGIDQSVCVTELEMGVFDFWTNAFVMSKLVDLIDTAFVVLRKQKLIFLHWYHHAITLIFTWYMYRNFSSIGRWFIAMNFTVHAFMYTYYAFKAARFKIPKKVSIFITTLQLCQMIIGIWLNVFALTKKLNGEKCDTPMEGLCFALLIYFSFFLLFANFFRQAYLKKENSSVKMCAGSELDSRYFMNNFHSKKVN